MPADPEARIYLGLLVVCLLALVVLSVALWRSQYLPVDDQVDDELEALDLFRGPDEER